VVEDLIDMGRWQQGDRDILIVFDAGYDAPRMAHLLEELPVEILGRMRTDRVMRKAVPVPWISPPQGGRSPKHGKEFRFAKPSTCRSRATSTFPWFNASYIAPCPRRCSATSVRSTGEVTGPSAHSNASVSSNSSSPRAVRQSNKSSRKCDAFANASPGLATGGRLTSRPSS
jgi:hypothetical protein